MEALALENKAKFESPKICVKGLSCNLSGLENLAMKLYASSADKALVSAYVLEFIGKTLEKITQNIRNATYNQKIVYAGGVMSNKIIQGRLGAKFKDVYFASPEFSADNGAGIALLALERYSKEER